MVFIFDSVPEDKKFVECAVCLEPWQNPQEITPCGHIFCAACVGTLTFCPECRASIASLQRPNRMLMNIVSALGGSCSMCTWRGTYDQFVASKHALCHGSNDEELSIGLTVSSVSQIRPPSPPSCRSADSKHNLTTSADCASQPLWKKYDLLEEEYFLIRSALAAATLPQKSSDATPPTQAEERCGSSSLNRRTVEEMFQTLTIDTVVSFARLMGYPSMYSDVNAVFEKSEEEEGQFQQQRASTSLAISGGSRQISERQLLTWCSSLAAKRRLERTYDLSEEEFLSILTDMHEYADFKRCHGVLRGGRAVSYVLQCRAAAKRCVRSFSSDDAEKEREGDALFRSILRDTRHRVPEGYPVDGVLLVDVLAVAASSDEGFEYCEVVSSPVPKATTTKKEGRRLSFFGRHSSSEGAANPGSVPAVSAPSVAPAPVVTAPQIAPPAAAVPSQSAPSTQLQYPTHQGSPLLFAAQQSPSPSTAGGVSPVQPYSPFTVHHHHHHVFTPYPQPQQSSCTPYYPPQGSQWQQHYSSAPHPYAPYLPMPGQYPPPGGNY